MARMTAGRVHRTIVRLVSVGGGNASFVNGRYRLRVEAKRLEGGWQLDVVVRTSTELLGFVEASTVEKRVTAFGPVTTAKMVRSRAHRRDVALFDSIVAGVQRAKRRIQKLDNFSQRPTRGAR